MLDATPEAIVDMPHDSLWPFFLVVGLTVFFYGALVRTAIFAAVGGIAAAISVLGWIWPRGQTQEM
jgi:hypothetical protein